MFFSFQELQIAGLRFAGRGLQCTIPNLQSDPWSATCDYEILVITSPRSWSYTLSRFFPLKNQSIPAQPYRLSMAWSSCTLVAVRRYEPLNPPASEPWRCLTRVLWFASVRPHSFMISRSAGRLVSESGLQMCALKEAD